jgi:DNA-binding transcriptional regulator YhcF (GntR family)
MKYRSIKKPPNEGNIPLENVVAAARALSNKGIEVRTGRFEFKKKLSLNRKRPESMTRQIREQLNGLIDAGSLEAGTFLPSERELANSLKVARNVVRGAYEQLMEAGKLRSEGNKGTTVQGASKKGKVTSKRLPASSKSKQSMSSTSHRSATSSKPSVVSSKSNRSASKQR